MSKKVLVNLDMNKNQIENLVLQNLSADITWPVAWLVFYDTDDNRAKLYTGSSYEKLLVESDASWSMVNLSDTNIVTPAWWNVLLYDGIDSWDNKALSWDIAIDSTWLTTIQPWAVDFAMLNSADISTDLSVSAAADELATAAAAKAYADSVIATADAFTLQWKIDCSANPDYPAADAWHAYVVSVAWKIGWVSWTNVDAWDMIVCRTDSTASWDQATVWDSWFILETNREQATEITSWVVELATVSEVEAKTDTQRAVTPAWLTSFTRKYTWTIGNGVLTSIPVTHGLGSQYVIAKVFDETTWAEVQCDIDLTSATQTTFIFNTAPTADEYRVVIIG